VVPAAALRASKEVDHSHDARQDKSTRGGIVSLAEQVRADRHSLRIVEAQQEGGSTPGGGERFDQRSAQAKVCRPRGGARVKE
jgi:hypothetical protein